jgi:hypothetical protein
MSNKNKALIASYAELGRVLLLVSSLKTWQHSLTIVREISSQGIEVREIYNVLMG